MKNSTMIGAIVVLVLVIAGLYYWGSPATGEVKEVRIDAKNFSFTPAGFTAKRGETVKIILRNQEGNHNIAIDEFSVASEVIEAGKETTVQFVADKTGTFQFYCAVGNHRQMGMVGSLTITE